MNYEVIIHFKCIVLGTLLRNIFNNLLLKFIITTNLKKVNSKLSFAFFVTCGDFNNVFFFFLMEETQF